jgi:hypothetical protein
MLTRPIFLLGSHKSGSSLLRSLLDGHPSLYVIPAETHFFQRTGHWVDYALRPSEPQVLSRDEMIAALVKSVGRKNEGAGRVYGDSDLSGRIDVAAFKASLEQGPLDDDRSAFETYVRSLHRAIVGHQLDGRRRIVEKSVENAEHAPTLRRMFPDCRFLHIVRNPYASLVAIRRSKSREGFPNLVRAARALQNSYYNLYRNERALDNYLVITYEELTSDPRATMTRCAEFLDIEFDDVLLTPTLLGEPWAGNSSRGTRFTAVDASPSQSWRSQITDVEIRLVNASLSPVLSRFGYPRLTPRSHWLRPTRREGLTTYVQNRMHLWMGND